MDLIIAVGGSRFSDTWRNKRTTWPDFIKLLSNTRRTGETMADYKKMPKSDRDNRKDIGGFVGGRLQGRQRLRTSVLNRTLICLDADNGADDFMLNLDLAYPDTAWAVYSTHSHTPQTPRYRLIFPVDREIIPDEYQPIARKIAEHVGIEYFDPTTYDLHRLMYWPSTPLDGPYVFETNAGKPISPDTVLAEYGGDWQNAALWPISTLETKAHTAALKKQQDPTGKPGIVGAFCRAYTITSAIDAFLSEVYEQKTDGRYTYAKGSTSGGVVIYDDMFAYSHHGTDPASEQLCNAFDLVRIHLYGDKDGGKEYPLPTQYPSYKAMTQFARGLPAVQKEIAEESAAEIKELFDDSMLSDDDKDTTWMQKLTRTPKTLEIEQTAQNVTLILQNDPLLKGLFAFNQFSRRLVLRKKTPWPRAIESDLWSDEDDACLRNYMSRYYKIVNKNVIYDVVNETAQGNAFHPVRDYLKSLTWDGKKRAEMIYIKLLGADNTAYVKEVTFLHLKAAVARVMHPGCKFDEMIVLSGPQGKGKTSIFRWLGGPWFNESVTTITSKDAMEQLQGSWIVELAEMQATHRAENDAIKGFVSRRVDRFRAAYGRRTVEYPRQCVFTSTTNDDEFLRDRTGGRRFWPITISRELNLKELTSVLRDQIWAEVYDAYMQDQSIELSRAGRIAAKEQQDAAMEGSEKLGLLDNYLQKKLPKDWDSKDTYERITYLREYSDLDDLEGLPRMAVSRLEIWCECFDGMRSKFTAADSREIGAMIKNTSWWDASIKRQLVRLKNDYGVQRCYVKSDTTI